MRKPIGQAILLDERGRVSRDGGAVPIFETGALFAELGLSPEQNTNWHQRFGYDSLGVGDEEERLLPDFPTLGRLVDVIVDPVILNPEECAVLALECDRALERGLCPWARNAFQSLQSITAEAVRLKRCLWIGGC